MALRSTASLQQSAKQGEVDAFAHPVGQVARDRAELHALLHGGDGVGIRVAAAQPELKRAFAHGAWNGVTVKGWDRWP